MKARFLSTITDDQLAAEVPRLAQQERVSTADFVECLAEFDARRLHLGLGFPSIYAYCAARLQLSDGAAYRRIETARASRRYPAILDMLRDGRLSLATAAMIASKMTPQNADELLADVAFKTKREVELILARRNPQPPVPASMRKLPDLPIASEIEPQAAVAAAVVPIPPSPASTPPSRRPVVTPLSESHYKLQVTIGTAARERLKEIQALMRHRLPNGDPAAIVEHALEVLHGQLLKEKAALVAAPREGRAAIEAKGRYIPASVKRAVWRRDAGRCAFTAQDGRRCNSEDGVEFHHLQPFAVGGEASIENLALRCRAHNGFEWERHLDEDTASLMPSATRPATPAMD